MRLRLTFGAVAIMALQSSLPAAQVEPTKLDTEFALTAERGDAPTRPRIRLQNHTAVALAICINSINFELRRQDGSIEGGGADFAQGVGGSRCDVVENWSVVSPSESWFTVLELPSDPAPQSGDELLVKGFVRVGKRVGDMADSKLGLYLWRGKLGQLEKSRGGPTRG